MCKILNRFNVSDFKEISPEFFEIPVSTLEAEIKRRKLLMSKKNISQFLMWKIKKDNWSVTNIVTTALELELEYVVRYSNRFEWTANSFVELTNYKEIADLGDTIRTTIRKYKQDASVSVKATDDFFWISISLKNLKKLGIFQKPHYIVVSADGKYFFTKDNRYSAVIKYVTTALGYEREKRKKLSGRSLPTLLKLLVRKEKADNRTRPVFEGGEAVENEFGLDFTQKKQYLEYYDRCVDNEKDINLQRYTVRSVNYPWKGDDNPVLKKVEFRSVLILSGNVARIIRHLPLTTIVKPPLPNYLENFSVFGRNVVSLKNRSHEM